LSESLSLTERRSPIPTRSISLGEAASLASTPAVSPIPTRSHWPSPTQTMSPVPTRSQSPSLTGTGSPTPTRSGSPGSTASLIGMFGLPPTGSPCPTRSLTTTAFRTRTGQAGCQRVTSSGAGSLDVLGMSFASCSATGDGGAISADHEELWMSIADCAFASCRTSTNGGGISLRIGAAVVIRCGFSDCTASTSASGALVYITRMHSLDWAEVSVVSGVSKRETCNLRGDPTDGTGRTTAATAALGQTNLTGNSASEYAWGGMYSWWAHFSLQFWQFETNGESSGLLWRGLRGSHFRCLVVRSNTATGTRFPGIFCSTLLAEGGNYTIWDSLVIDNTIDYFVSSSNFTFRRCYFDQFPGSVTLEGRIEMSLCVSSAGQRWAVPVCLPRSASAWPKETDSASPTATRSESPSLSATGSPTRTRSISPTETESMTPTPTLSPSSTRSQSPTLTESGSALPTRSDSPSASETGSPIPTRSESPLPTETGSPSITRSVSPTGSVTARFGLSREVRLGRVEGHRVRRRAQLRQQQ
jgi:hypothetical protein